MSSLHGILFKYKTREKLAAISHDIETMKKSRSTRNEVELQAKIPVGCKKPVLIST